MSVSNTKREPTGSTSLEERTALIAPPENVEKMDGNEKSNTVVETEKTKPDNVQLQMEDLSSNSKEAITDDIAKPHCNDGYKDKFPLHWAAASAKYKAFEKLLNSQPESANLTEKDCHGNTILMNLCYIRKDDEDANDVIHAGDVVEEQDESEYSDIEETSEVIKLINSCIPKFCRWSSKEASDPQQPNDSEDLDESESHQDRNNREDFEIRDRITIQNTIELFLQKVINKTSAKLVNEFVNTKYVNGNTALHYVAMNQFEKLVKLLLNHGADATIQNENGDTPLHLLTERNSSDARLCTDLLLDKMPKKDVLNANDDSVLGAAMSKFSTASAEIIQLMINKGCSVSPIKLQKTETVEKKISISILHRAVVNECATKEESFAPFEVFVNALSEEEINRKNKYGNTALHLAAYYLEVYFLKYLLKHEKIDIYSKDRDGDTAFHLIATRGSNRESAECVELLMQKAGTDENMVRLFNQKNYKKLTALEISVQKDSVPLAEIILMSHPEATSVLKWMRPKLFQRIYEKVPEIFLPILNKSINYEGKNYEANAEIFSANITVLSGDKNKAINEKENKQVPEVIYRETDYLAKLLESRYVEKDEMESFLSHPIVSLFILEKWEKLKSLYWCAMFCKILWLFAYISFSIDVFWYSFPYENKSNNSTDTLNSNSAEKESSDQNHDENGSDSNSLNFMQTSAGLILAVSNAVLFAFKILLSYNTVGFKKTLTPGFLIRLLFTTFIGFILISVCYEGVKDWHHVAIAMSVIWIAFIWVWDLRDFPVFGKYADVFFIVMKNFVRFVISFLPLFVGFSIAIGLMLRMKTNFGELHWNVVKIFVMMLGEINFDEIFGEGESILPYTSFAKLVVGLFVITIPIVLLNLLLGFTVSDVQVLKDKGEIKVRISTLEHIIIIERFVLSPVIQKVLPTTFLQRFIMERKLDKKYKCHLCIKMVDIPKEIRDRIREISRLHQWTKSHN